MNRVINKRPALFIAVAMLCGSAIGGLFWSYNLGLAITASLIAVLGAVTLIKKKYLYFALALAMTISMLAACLTMNTANVKIYQDDGEISARICHCTEKSSGKYEYRLEDITLNGSELRYKALMVSEEKYEIGNVLCISGDLSTYYLSPTNSYSVSRFSKGLRYKITPEKITVTKNGKKKLTERTHESIVDLLQSNMGEESGVAIAVLLGERSYMNDKDYDAMETAGIGHIFAVSGLHVMTIAGGVYFVLRLAKVHKKIAHCIVIALLLFYGGVVGFSASILRAILMLCVSVIAELTERPPDLLSRLSLAMIISLLIRPLSIFDVSFQMSYGAVAGIALLAAPARRSIADNPKLPKSGAKFLSSLAYTSLINLFMIPMMLSKFGSIGLYSIPANLLIVPVVSVAYMALFAAIVICLIFPSLGFFIQICGYPFLAFSKISAFIASLPYATFDCTVNMPAALFFTMAIALFSPVFLIDKKYKTLGSAVLAAVGILLTVFI